MPTAITPQGLSACLLLLAGWLLAVPLWANGHRPSYPPTPSLFFQVSNQQQIAEQIITAILQDQQGFLWVGTSSGLYRYDGYRFVRFSDQSEQLSGRFIQSLYLRQNGELWITAVPGGVSHFNAQTLHFSSFDDFPEQQLPFWQSAQVLAEDQQQRLWVGSRNGLAYIDGSGQSQLLSHPTLSELNIRALLVDNDNRLWIGHRQGLIQLDLNAAELDPIAITALSGQSVLSMQLAEDGSIWLGTASAGVYVWESDTKSLQPFPVTAQTEAASPVHDLLLLPNDEIWLARLGGIERWQRSSQQLLHRDLPDPSDRFSLAHADVRALHQDREGVIWVGSYGGGLQHFQRSRQVSMLRYSLLHQHSLSSPDISSILELSNGEIWLGSRGSGVDIVQPGQGIVARIEPGADSGQLQQGWVTAMTQRPDGKVWLATYPHGVYQVEPDSRSVQMLLSGTDFNESVRRFFTDSLQRLWLGTQQGLYLWDDGVQQLVSYPLLSPSPQADYLNALTEDPLGQLWVGGGATGLYRLHPGQSAASLVHFANRDTPTLSILGLLVAHNKLWLDTPEGLYFIDDFMAEQPLLHPASADAPSSAFGANLLQDSHGRIWSQQRLFNPVTGQLKPLAEHDGFLIGTPWFRAYQQSHDGKMLFGSTEGLLVVDADAYQPASDVFAPLVITALHIDGRATSLPTAELQIEPQQRGFSLEFAALDLLQANALRYRYQLTGFDDNWRTMDASQRQLSYTNLWPGHYQLRIQSSNAQGDWNPELLTLDIRVLPKLWQQGWFALLCLLLLIAVLTALYLWRMRTERRKAIALRHQVTRQQRELEAAQKLLVEKEKMASLGQVVAGVAHELNTPLGIGLTSSTVLLNETEQMTALYQQKQITNQKMQSFLQHCREHLQLLIKNLERSADLVHHFKQVAVDQNDARLQSIQLPHWLQERIKPYQLGYPDIDFHLSCPQMQLELRAQALEQIIFQLLQNCCLHAFAMSGSKQVRIELSITATECHLLIEDDGQGIAPDIQQRIFEPFVTSKRGSQCHGLGLHLSYNLASQVLNGSIELQHSSPEGTRFLVRFPRQPEAL